MDYKNTIITPKTDFPMKAGLPTREPGMLSRWEEQNLYRGTWKETASAAQNQTARSGGAGALWHTVKRGETLWGIARSYEVELTDLIARNPQIKNPNLILPGEQVKIR